MQRENKRGQEVLGMSYGVIFSIILIVVIIAVAFYAISHFMELANCGKIGTYYNDLKGEIDKAWNADQYRDVFKGNLPSKIEKVCFGNLSQSVSGADANVQRTLRDSNCDDNGGRNNVFMYPPQKACGGDMCTNVLEHVKVTGGFFCISKDTKGKFNVNLETSASNNGIFVILSKT